MRKLIWVLAVVMSSGCASTTTSSDGRTGRAGETTVRVEGRNTGTRTVSILSDDQTRRAGYTIDAATGWSEVPRLVEELGLPVGYVDDSARRIGHEGRRVRRLDGKRLSNFLECGMGATAQPYANAYDVTISWELELRLVDGGPDARPEMRFVGSAKPRDVSGAALPCTSKGRFEQLVFDRLVGM